MCQKCESPLEKKFHQCWLANYKNISLESQIIVKVTSSSVKTRRIDFGFRSLKLGVEVDSRSFHSTRQQKKHDKEREKELKREGWTLIHLQGKDVYHRTDQCCLYVYQQMKKRKHPFASFLRDLFWKGK